MPNYCNVNITFSVKKEEDRHLLDKLEQEFKTKNEILNVLRPMPEGCLEEGKWYDWCNCNWGTKWDMMEGYNIGMYSHDLYVCGETAWSPPEEALLHYHLQHPQITIDILYFEPGMCFAGHTRFEDGEEIEVAIVNNFTCKTKAEWEADNTEFGEFFCAQMEDCWDNFGMDSDEEGESDDPIIPESSDVGGLDKE
jgi:hypothetical protein